ncbi:MAG: sigma-54 dependent transcriptional regulator [Terriglobia bacterium]|jgi:DNA-binding NtrC family response regulator
MSQTNADLGDSESGGHEISAAATPTEQNPAMVILAIDDDPGILGFYKAIMRGMGVRFESSTDPRQAMDLVAAHDPSLVILDVTMPGLDGMELLHRIKSRDPQTRVVMITGNYMIDMAVKAIQEGAIDYVCKPVTAEKLRELVNRVRTLITQEERTRTLVRELAEVSNLEGIIGRSPRMLEVFDLIQRVAPHFRTAVIIGESGSGRKTVARGLHNLSPGKNQRFAVFKSEFATENPVESQPSNQGSGGFTGAVVREAELFESAIGGTVFLDEIGDLSGATQLRLLQLLDQAAAKEASSPLAPQEELRVIASTSRDIQAETQSGRFRADLWYRLSMVQIHLPPLRERADDILLLAHHFLTQYSAQYGKAVRRMSLGAEAVLVAYSWPGNVSELANVVGRACMLAEGNVLDCGDLPAGIVLPGYGVDVLGSSGRGLSLPVGQKSSSTETLRQKVRDMLEHDRDERAT